jgi:hypothetical protein
MFYRLFGKAAILFFQPVASVKIGFGGRFKIFRSGQWAPSEVEGVGCRTRAFPGYFLDTRGSLVDNPPASAIGRDHGRLEKGAHHERQAVRDMRHQVQRINAVLKGSTLSPCSAGAGFL